MHGETYNRTDRQTERQTDFVFLLVKKEKMHVILNALSLPDFVIPCGLSTLYIFQLTTMTQNIPLHELPLIGDCCNHKGSFTLVSPYLIIVAGIISLSFVRVSTRQLAVNSSSKGNSSTLNFHKSIGTGGTRTRYLSNCKRAEYWLS